MNAKKALEVLNAAEKAGIRTADCQHLAEARRIAAELDRPAAPPAGCVYRNSNAELEAALIASAAEVAARMKKASAPKHAPDGKADDGGSAGKGAK